MDERILGENDFIRKLFNAIPSILLLTDDDVRVLGLNVAASELLGVSIEEIYNQRGGNVWRCIHAYESPEGCGHEEDCKECVIRNSVRKSFSGATVYQQKTMMELRRDDGKTIKKHFLVTTSPFEYLKKSYALLILEDISELEQLRDIIQICSSCKKVINDEGRWEQIELYVREHSKSEFSHGLCPECAKRLYPEYCGVPCWEYMKCGHEVDKSCPVVMLEAGRRCWDVSSTLCGGKRQGQSFTKFHLCKECDFFIKLNRGEI
ncbi:MAG: hypothetical protein HQL08_10050 [Nitrospirae bacterium]|nr:hypothetical protein [Nitrospirota bacterium]